MLASGSNCAVKPTRLRRAAYFRSLVPSYSALCRPAFIPTVRLYQRFLLWGFGATPGFACILCAGFKSFWPPALVQQAQTAIILAALRRFRGPALFRGLRPCPSLGASFWPSGLTRRSSRPAYGGRLTLAVRPSILPLYAGPHLFQRFAFLKRFSAGVLAVWRASPGACALFQAF